jgi:hypothetical protein
MGNSYHVPVTPTTSRERGNRRERVFFGNDAYELHRDLLASRRRKRGVACGPPA